MTAFSTTAAAGDDAPTTRLATPDPALAVPLEGGRVTRGVVRIGDTVRRPTGVHSPFVHRVLEHLSSKRFAGAPTFMGIDDRRREVLSFVAGDVPRDLAWFSTTQLTAAARLLRTLHDATADFPALRLDDVVCHGDASPCNHVFRDDLPIALIDFDAAHVGRRQDDLGYAAWLWLDLGNPSVDARDQGRRLAVFFDAYGAPARHALAIVGDAQDALAGRGASRPEMREWALDCRRYMLRHAPTLAAGLVDHSTARRLPPCPVAPSRRPLDHPLPIDP